MASVRVRLGKGLRLRLDPPEKRVERIRELARMLADAGKGAEGEPLLKKAAVDPAYDRHVEALVAGKLRRKGASTAPATTFRMVGESWTSGDLARDYPDHVRIKRTREEDASRFEKYIYGKLGPKTVSEITLADVEQVMSALPGHLSPLTRRHIGGSIARLLKICVYPLRLIERSPIPSGFLPNRGKRKALAYLYPDEERRLLACTNVPLCFRLLWGFLTREGMREGEALALTWSALDLKRGSVTLDKNKTDDPRAWALDPHVAMALAIYQKKFRTNAKPEDRVFVDPHGDAHSKFGIAMLLRSHLEAVGLKKERPELFVTTEERQQIRVHDLRGTFVTISLANGRSESWISDRTGHRSSAMIARYKRQARHVDELGLGALAPFDDAIPELGGGPEGGPEIEIEYVLRRPQRDSNPCYSLERAVSWSS
jgi:integrase